MASPAGLEPATLCLEGRCSIQLSYGLALYCDSNSLQNILVFQFRPIEWDILIAQATTSAQTYQQNCLYFLQLDIHQALVSSSSSFFKLFFLQAFSFIKPFSRQRLSFIALLLSGALVLPFNAVCASLNAIDVRVRS
jgi:hypothetical protein